MSNGSLENLSEIFAAPIEGVIAALGKGIADAQTELDHASAAAQEAINGDPVLSRSGVQATWYQFPRVEMKLKLAVSVAQDTTTTTTATPTPVGAPLLRLVAQPVTASYQNRFNFDAQASSVITVTLVPVPNPSGADQGAVVPKMTTDDVQATALATGKFETTGTAPNLSPSPSLRFDLNFNPTSRLWYALQYSATDATKTPVLVVIDDVTGQVRA
jgi:enterochelin esterase-like enzyme